jgi:hypothetical protein
MYEWYAVREFFKPTSKRLVSFMYTHGGGKSIIYYALGEFCHLSIYGDA